MKKTRTLILTSVLALVMIFSALSVCYGGTDQMNDPSLERIVDNAQLFSAEEESILMQDIEKIADYGIDFAVYTTNDSYGKSDMALADDFYDENGYGAGEEFSGCVLCICMEENNRFWWLSCCGDAKKYFTEYNINHIDDDFYYYAVNGRFADAVLTYLENTLILLENGPDVWQASSSGNQGGYSNQNYYDVDPGYSVNPKEKLINILGIGAGMGIFAGAISLIIALNGMKSVRKATRAVNYLDRSSFNLSIMRDIFLYRSTTRTKIQKQQPRGGGGGRSSFSGGHISSSGRSHSGGGRHF